MTPRHIQAVFFSPTGGTKSYIEAFCSRYPEAQISLIDMTTSTQKVELTGDLIVLGAPVYEGTIPETAAQRFRSISGDAIPTVTLVSYGQVEYGAALYQLEQIARGMGLTPFCSIAAPAHHSFSTDKAPLAFGRPDEQDLRDMRRCELVGGTTPKKRALMSLLMPTDSAKILTKVPKVDDQLCISCGLCVKACPVSSISSRDFSIDPSVCLRCFACVKVCPTSARAIKYRLSPIVTRFLKYHDRQRAPLAVFSTEAADLLDIDL